MRKLLGPEPMQWLGETVPGGEILLCLGFPRIDLQ